MRKIRSKIRRGKYNQMRNIVTSILLAVISILLAVISMAMLVLQNNTETTQVPVTRVIDGDTIEVEINGEIEHIRFIGVDAPEMGFRGRTYEIGATEATEFVQAQINAAGGLVELRSEGRDRDDTQSQRLRRHVYVDGVHLGCLMVAESHAVIRTIGDDRPLVCG